MTVAASSVITLLPDILGNPDRTPFDWKELLSNCCFHQIVTFHFDNGSATIKSSHLNPPKIGEMRLQGWFYHSLLVFTIRS